MKGLQRNRFKVRLFHLAMGLAGWMATLPNKLVPPPFRVIQMSSALWQSRALYVAVELGLADALGKGEKSSQAIAAELGLDADHTYRLMRMLASLGVFTECAPGRFRNSRLSDCLRSDHPQSVRAMVLMHHSPQMVRPWIESLSPCIRSGETPFVKTHGSELFAYMDSDAEFDALFTRAMESVEALTGDAYLQDFAWSRFERIIDVGGSNGKKSIAILKANPGLRALVFDRPQVVEGASVYWHDKIPAEVLQRLEFAGGDMRQAIPAAQGERDLYLFVAVFHSMGDREAGQVLQRLRQAMGSCRPTVVIADTVAPSCHIDPTIASFDMQMLIGTRGRERTRVEWQALLEANGFAIQEVVDVRTFARLIVIRPSG